MKWPIYKISYWNHPVSQWSSNNVNDCFGNSVSKKVKARTEKEAINKVKNKEKIFRLRKVEKTNS